MAKKAAAKGRAGSPLPAAGPQLDDGAQWTARPTKLKSSALLDTRVIYCGDNLEQLAKLPDACGGQMQKRDFSSRLLILSRRLSLSRLRWKFQK